jgi:ammonium transporter, Amt family
MTGGLIGTLLAGFMGTAPALAAVQGLSFGTGLDQLWRQPVDPFAVLAYSAFVTAILALIVKHTIGLRLGEEDEVSGIDEAEHAETGYDFVVAVGDLVHGRHSAEE